MAAFVVLVVGSFASFGGLGYAASGGAHALGTVAHVATGHKVVVRSSASDQYPTGQVAGAHTTKHHTHHKAVLAAPVKSGTLPFTGLSLAVTVLLSLALAAGGYFLRRAGRKEA